MRRQRYLGAIHPRWRHGRFVATDDRLIPGWRPGELRVVADVDYAAAYDEKFPPPPGSWRWLRAKLRKV